MPFVEHHARTVRPDAVPGVDEWTEYPHSVQAVLDPTAAPVERHVPIPHEN